MRKPKFLQENEMHKILCDFEIETDHAVFTWRSNLVLINKKQKAGHLVDIVVTATHRVKIRESKSIDKYLDLPRELNKQWKHEGDSDTSSSWCTWNASQRHWKKTGGNWKFGEESTPSRLQ